MPVMRRKRMTNKEFLADRRAALEDSIRYFSGANKAERERWVVVEFLTNLDIRHEDAEVASSPEDPPDVLFRDCRFEIKEILEPGRKRHDEYKQKHEKSLQAKHPRDLLEEYSPEHFTPDEIGEIVREAMPKYQTRYRQEIRQGMDLLFYVNYTNHFQKPGPVPSSDIFEPFGWRSVSVLEGWTSMTLFASERAPGLLRTRVGLLYHRKF